MKRFATAMLALVLGIALTATATAAELVRKQSAYPVAETLDRLAAILTERGVTVGLRIDHAGAAEGIGANLPATQLLLFGNPALGTPLMQEAREIAIDLPMKALAWEDDDGVWLGYIAPADLAARWGIDPEHPAIQKMTAALEATTNLATIPDAVNNPPKGARTIFTGLRYIDLKPGSGRPPADEQRIVRTLTDAWQADGKQVSNAILDGLDTNQVFELRRQLPILAKALESTPVGGKRRWWISKDLIPENPILGSFDHMIDIEVVDIVDPLPAPADVRAIPSDATVSENGIGYKVLVAGDGAHPTLSDDIEVHYSGWQTNGHMFDSSRLRMRTNTFPLGKLIQGWQETIPLMQVGERARIWIPGALAYDNREDRPFAPKGMLVFDVELVSINGGK
ncbi:MAG: FKBP-type peptidyl-prolyl cis-trans isomerase [Proteobacteria bacterium]|nr:FKBP-type peptidyl-prolyl cis-trans isomerase [Pseudomonadota bacterium]